MSMWHDRAETWNPWASVTRSSGPEYINCTNPPAAEEPTRVLGFTSPNVKPEPVEPEPDVEAEIEPTLEPEPAPDFCNSPHPDSPVLEPEPVEISVVDQMLDACPPAPVRSDPGRRERRRWWLRHKPTHRGSS